MKNFLVKGVDHTSIEQWYLTVKQFVIISGYHPGYVRGTLLRNGKLKSFKIGDSRLILIHDAVEYFLTYAANRPFRKRRIVKANVVKRQALVIDMSGKLQLNKALKNKAAISPMSFSKI